MCVGARPASIKAHMQLHVLQRNDRPRGPSLQSLTDVPDAVMCSPTSLRGGECRPSPPPVNDDDESHLPRLLVTPAVSTPAARPATAAAGFTCRQRVTALAMVLLVCHIALPYGGQRGGDRSRPSAATAVTLLRGSDPAAPMLDGDRQTDMHHHHHAANLGDTVVAPIFVRHHGHVKSEHTSSSSTAAAVVCADGSNMFGSGLRLDDVPRPPSTSSPSEATRSSSASALNHTGNASAGTASSSFKSPSTHAERYVAWTFTGNTFPRVVTDLGIPENRIRTVWTATPSLLATCRTTVSFCRVLFLVGKPVGAFPRRRPHMAMALFPEERDDVESAHPPAPQRRLRMGGVIDHVPPPEGGSINDKFGTMSSSWRVIDASASDLHYQRYQRWWNMAQAAGYRDGVERLFRDLAAAAAEVVLVSPTAGNRTATATAGDKMMMKAETNSQGRVTSSWLDEGMALTPQTSTMPAQIIEEFFEYLGRFFTAGLLSPSPPPSEEAYGSTSTSTSSSPNRLLPSSGLSDDDGDVSRRITDAGSSADGGGSVISRPPPPPQTAPPHRRKRLTLYVPRPPPGTTLEGIFNEVLVPVLELVDTARVVYLDPGRVYHIARMHFVPMPFSEATSPCAFRFMASYLVPRAISAMLAATPAEIAAYEAAFVSMTTVREEASNDNGRRAGDKLADTFNLADKQQQDWWRRNPPKKVAILKSFSGASSRHKRFAMHRGAWRQLQRLGYTVISDAAPPLLRMFLINHAHVLLANWGGNGFAQMRFWGNRGGMAGPVRPLKTILLLHPLYGDEFDRWAARPFLFVDREEGGEAARAPNASDDGLATAGAPLRNASSASVAPFHPSASSNRSKVSGVGRQEAFSSTRSDRRKPYPAGSRVDMQDGLTVSITNGTALNQANMWIKTVKATSERWNFSDAHLSFEDEDLWWSADWAEEQRRVRRKTPALLCGG